jgi:ribonuclease I
MHQEKKTERQIENEEAHKFIRTFCEQNRTDNALGEYAEFIADYYTAIQRFQSEINRYSGPRNIKVLIDYKDHTQQQIEGWIETQLSMYSDARKELSGTIKRLKNTRLSLAKKLMMKEAEESENLHRSM